MENSHNVTRGSICLDDITDTQGDTTPVINTEHLQSPSVIAPKTPNKSDMSPLPVTPKGGRPSTPDTKPAMSPLMPSKRGRPSSEKCKSPYIYFGTHQRKGKVKCIVEGCGVYVENKSATLLRHMSVYHSDIYEYCHSCKQMERINSHCFYN